MVLLCACTDEVDTALQSLNNSWAFPFYMSSCQSFLNWNLNSHKETTSNFSLAKRV